MNKSHYKFVWGTAYMPFWELQANNRSFARFRDYAWNQREDIIQVAKNGMVSCFHSDKDLQKDMEEGKFLLDEKYSKKMIEEMDRDFREHWKFFEELRRIKPSHISNDALYKILEKAIDRWALVATHSRVTQEEGSHCLVKEIRKMVSENDASVLMTPLKLDEIEKEIIEWQKLLKKGFSNNMMLKHCEKFPWIVSNHFSYRDILETFNQRYDYDIKNPVKRDIIKEKDELKERQEKIIGNNYVLRRLADVAQRLALSRAEVKACWAGMEFYLLDIFGEIARRSGESLYDLQKYYLIEEIKSLLEGRRLPKKEIERRKKYFVALWKDGKEIYQSGKEADDYAKSELKELYVIKETSIIKGNTANKGKIKGISRVLEANNMEQTRELRKSFQKGQILVTGMTQPNIMGIACKAGAIVTDEGGMLSHAAIISRELGIPCIVGTKIATSVIRDHDMVDVDADKGVIKILKRRNERKKHKTGVIK